MDEKMREIEERWDYPNADKLDWNNAKDDVDSLISRIKRLGEQLRLAIEHDLQPYPTAYAYEKVCEALHEKEARIKELEDGIEKHKLYMWGDGIVDHPADEELYKLIEKEKP